MNLWLELETSQRQKGCHFFFPNRGHIFTGTVHGLTPDSPHCPAAGSYFSGFLDTLLTSVPSGTAGSSISVPAGQGRGGRRPPRLGRLLGLMNCSGFLHTVQTFMGTYRIKTLPSYQKTESYDIRLPVVSRGQGNKPV